MQVVASVQRRYVMFEEVSSRGLPISFEHGKKKEKKEGSRNRRRVRRLWDLLTLSVYAAPVAWQVLIMRSTVSIVR